MIEFFVELITKIVNKIHDLIENVARQAGYNLSDKDLHFWVIGLLGITSFLVVHIIFKKLAEFSITAISFIYTFTVVLVVAFAIEIEQGITGRGHMELADALISLYGFLAMFAVYLMIVLSFKGTKALIKWNKKRNTDEQKRYYG